MRVGDRVCGALAGRDTEQSANQRHLMSRVAHEDRWLFIESLGLRRPQLPGRDLEVTAEVARTADTAAHAEGVAPL